MNIKKEKLYFAAIYIRLSKEEKEKLEGNSINSQKNLIYQFAEKQENLIISCERIDDGYTGTNFNRPAFKVMMEEIKTQKINCIIVKDFSRFGRNYLESCTYIEQIFPVLEVRFISINDGYDSEQINNNQIERLFKNILSEFYSRDLSEKVKSAKNTKAKKGEYLSAYALFGYEKSKEQKNKLVIKKETAKIVQRIFDMAEKGYSTNNIAKTFNDELIPTSKNRFWTKNTVTRILKDERYTGKAIYGRYKRIEVGKKKTIHTSKEDWIIVENQHEAIVTEEKFKKVNELLFFRQKEHQNKKPEVRQSYFLSGKIKCGVCSYALERKKEPNPRYYCVNRYYTTQNFCIKGYILESIIEQIIFFCMYHYIYLLLNKKKEELNDLIKEKNKNKIEKKIEQLESSLKKIRRLKIRLYEQYRDGKQRKESFQEKQEKYNQQEEEIAKEIETQRKNLESFILIADIIKPDLIKKVFVYNENRIEIRWKFCSVFGYLFHSF